MHHNNIPTFKNATYVALQTKAENTIPIKYNSTKEFKIH